MKTQLGKPKSKPGDPLTDRQAEVYRAIVAHYVEHGRAPTFRELADAMGFAAQNGAVSHVKALAKKGVVVASAGMSRGIAIPALTVATQQAAASLLVLCDLELQKAAADTGAAI